MIQTTRNKVFISYSHQDKEWLERLQKMLKPWIRSQTIDVWDDTKIQAGSLWRDEIKNALATAKVAVLMVSPDFLASDFIDKHQLRPLLQAAQEGGLTVIWIYISACLYKETEIANYQPAHDISKPLDTLSTDDLGKILTEICQEIKKAATENQGSSSDSNTQSQSRKEVPSTPPKKPIQVFLACASEDKHEIGKLYNKLKKEGYKPWFYQHDLIAGQNWREEIPKAIQNSHIFVACFSNNSVNSAGYIQEEYRLALREYNKRKKQNIQNIYFIPLRLDECELPQLSIDNEIKIDLSHFQRIDYWKKDGFDLLVRAIKHEDEGDKKPQPKPPKWLFPSFVAAALLAIIMIPNLHDIIIPSFPKSTPPVKVKSYPVEACNNTPYFMSCGEKDDLLNFPQNVTSLPEEIKGRKAFENHNYKEAINYLEKAMENEDDPSTLIALNNARVMQDIKDGKIDHKNVFTIAISSGFKQTPDGIGESILSGVAWQQNEVNCQSKIKNCQANFKLIVVIADDSNRYDIATYVAKELVNRKDIIAFIGPYSSHATFYALDESRKGKLVLVSATSTATLDIFKEQYRKANKSQDMSWFFRPVPTTTIGAEQLAKYLQYRGYKKVALFYQDQDLFALSFYRDLKQQLEQLNIEIVKQINLDNPENQDNIDKHIADLKKNFHQEKDQTALVLLTDAYTKSYSMKIKGNVIDKNKGEFLIGGSNSLFHAEILALQGTVGKENLENMVISTPYYISPQIIKKSVAYMNNNPLNLSPKDMLIIGRTYMSYDATKMLTQAISQQIKEGKTPTREGIREVLASRDFEVDGITGKITLKGSDRQEQFNSLVRPDCSKEPCGWKEIESYPAK